jgi:hypothetical protein
MKGSVVSSSGLETDSGSEYYKKRMEGQSDDEARVRDDVVENLNSKKSLKDLNELKSEQSNFTGAENYYPDFMGMKLTDGTKYTMERAKCGWLMSDVAVIVNMKLKKEEFVVVTTKVKDHKAVVTYDDGNGKVLYEQNYEYTDLPDGEFKMYHSNGVLMLPSEY